MSKATCESEQRCQTAQGALALRVAPLFRLSGVARRLQTVSGLRSPRALERRKIGSNAAWLSNSTDSKRLRPTRGLRGNGASRSSRGPVRDIRAAALDTNRSSSVRAPRSKPSRQIFRYRPARHANRSRPNRHRSPPHDEFPQANLMTAAYDRAESRRYRGSGCKTMRKPRHCRQFPQRDQAIAQPKNLPPVSAVIARTEVNASAITCIYAARRFKS